MRNFRHLLRLQATQKIPGRGRVEQRVRGLDAQEEPVAGGQREPRRVEDRMVRHGQAPQSKETEHSRESPEQNGQLEGDDDIRRPAIERTSADVDGEANDRDVILQQESSQTADDAAGEHDERQLVPVQVQRVGEAVDGEWRERVELAVPLLARRPGGLDQRGGVVEFGHQTVDALGHPRSSLTLACGSKVRTSKMEIMGNKRINRKNRNRNKPMVPAKVNTSQRVAWKIPQEEGRKSCARLDTMIMKRSSHMPTSTTIDETNSNAGFVRTRLIQRNCGAMMLQLISSQ